MNSVLAVPQFDELVCGRRRPSRGKRRARKLRNYGNRRPYRMGMMMRTMKGKEQMELILEL